MQEIHGLLKDGVDADKISTQLSPWSSALFEFLPPFMKKQVLIDILAWDFSLFSSSHVNEYEYLYTCRLCFAASFFSILSLMILLSYPR